MAKQWLAKTNEGADEPPRAVKRRGLLAGAVALAGAALASRGIGTVVADEAATSPTTQRLLYDMQSPDVWYEDFGEGTLVNGKAEIKIAPDFAASVDTAKYHVFLTSHDPASKGLAVAARQADLFTVQEHTGGTSNLTFSWRMVARPKGSTAQRGATLTLPQINIPDPRALPTPPAPPLPLPRP